MITTTNIILSKICDKLGVVFVDSRFENNKTVYMKGYLEVGEYVLLIESTLKDHSFDYLIKSTIEMKNLGKAPRIDSFGMLTIQGHQSVAIMELE